MIIVNFSILINQRVVDKDGSFPSTFGYDDDSKNNNDEDRDDINNYIKSSVVSRVQSMHMYDTARNFI